MDMEGQVVDALRDELERQRDAGSLKLDLARTGFARVEGEIDLEALAMAAVGKVAGGP